MPDATENKVRQGAPSTAGQIAPEAWRAMSEAAQRAGMPLEEWLKSQLFGTMTASPPSPGAPDPVGSVADLQRRIEQLSGQIEQLGASAASPAQPPLTSAPAKADDRLESTIRELNERLEALNVMPARAETPAYAPAAPAARPADPVEMAVAEIAARQHELDGEIARRRTPSAEPPRVPASSLRESAAHDSIRDRFVRDPFAGGPFPTRANPVPSSHPVAPPIAPSAPPAPPRSPINDALSALQGELGEMRQSLGTLAPRRAVDELQRVVQQLADRVERSGTRDEDLRATLLALRDMIGGLKLPEHPALLLGRIDTLERKLDIVNAKAIDGATIARLQAQATEIRDLLARSLSADSVRLLAEQVSLLATKVSEMAANEDRAIRSAVGSLERRLDTLADRIASQPAPVLPLADLIARLDSIQSSLASARHEMPPGLEAMLRGLADRMERIERPEENLRLDVLGRQISELTQKIEKAVAGAEIAGQLASIERAVNDLFIQMEETRATFLATGSRPRPPAGGNPNGGAARIKREIAALEAEREAPPAASMASASMASAFTTTAVVAPVEAAAPAVPEASFSPPPASIPKPFEPQLMRAALEELSRSAEAASLRGETPPAPEADPAPAPMAPTPIDDEFDFRPVDLDAQAAANAAARAAAPTVPNVTRPAGLAAAPGAPNRAAFIAQARRATLPAGAGTPELRSHITERNRRQPTRWLARIRAMLLIGLCGSALAYGSWHFLAQMREQQLRAAAPAATNTAKLPPAAKPTPPGTVPAPEDITGSVGKSAPRAQPPAQAPAEPPAAAPEAAPPAPIGPSSMSLPTELPGGIASQALRAAALAGDPAAAFEIARRFTDGEGVPPSPARAAEWLAYAAKNGSIPAAYRLGSIYEKGMDGVPRDVAKARQLYEQAANAGNVAAMHNLGVMLASGAAGQPDYRTAVTWFTLAAERGVRDSQYNLAVLYARGFGVPANPAEAWRWFALAAARGDGEAALKRDEVATKVDARTLATLRSTVESWAPLMVDAKANDTPAVSWDDVPRKTASR